MLLLPRHGDAERVVEALVAEVEAGEVVERGRAHGAGDRLERDGLEEDAVVLGDLMPPGAAQQLVGEFADEGPQGADVGLT
ncbi:hypothetical protein [Nannocystis sp.]|uniref:hypothetical protein n=1 Tax=Nannocystis sp. TaxID=1962667 RepID=UPI0025E385D6|nr:hypothetical protein [Nannocystis sp.]